MSKAEYIKRTIEHMDAEIERQELKQNLIRVSLIVRKESMRVNTEFDEIDMLTLCAQ